MTKPEAVAKSNGLWLVVQGVAHLFLNPGPQPVCGAWAPADRYPEFALGGPVCEECDSYYLEVLLPQAG